MIAARDGYYSVRLLLDRLASTGHGIEPILVDLQNLEALRGALQDGPALVWAETPTNPLLRILDIGALARIAGEHESALIVDNTVATPLL